MLSARQHLAALATLAAVAVSPLRAQAAAAIPDGNYRGTLSFGDRLLLVQMRMNAVAGPRIQIAAPIGFDDTTSRPMVRDPRGDTLLAIFPGMSDSLRLAPRLEGSALRGTVRQGAAVGTIALRRVVELPLEVIKPRLGEYRLDSGELFVIEGAENTFDGLSYINFGTGRTGALFPLDSAHFVAGSRRYDTDPPSFTVHFESRDRIVVTTADGRIARGNRTAFYTAKEISFPTTGGVSLAGTFTVPTTRGAGPYPAVILLHGSEPNSRFRGNVVTFFASLGIAVLSWDKRGNFASGGDLQTANIDTMAADGEAAIRWLRARPEIDPRRVGVWGISQGGWPASVIAAHDSSLAFVMLHAGSSLTPAKQAEDEYRMSVPEQGGTPAAVDTVLTYYRLYNEVRRGHTTLDSLEKTYKALKAAGDKRVWSPATVNTPRARWLAGIIDFDPVPYWSRAHVPVLAMFGESDGYVPPETNVPVLRAAFARSGNRDTTIVVFKNANHRFEEATRRIVRDWVTGSRYLPDYYDTMATWLSRHHVIERAGPK